MIKIFAFFIFAICTIGASILAWKNKPNKDSKDLVKDVTFLLSCATLAIMLVFGFLSLF